ncbi:MAG: cell envelope integrity protein TolA [Betaproteobacteria bacterium]|nr:cell envelope integrity protein TolA [Betaproteobacteria bacterium]
MVHAQMRASSPPESSAGLAFLGSLVLHIVLGAAMVLAVHRPPPEDPVVQAELWSSLPPMQPARPAPPVTPAPEPAPVAPAEPMPPAPEAAEPVPSEADIALEKKRAEEDRALRARREAQERAEKERIAQQRAAQEKLAREKTAKDRAEKDKAEKAAREEAARQSALAQKKAAEDLKRRAEQEKVAKQKAAEEEQRRQAAIKKEVDRQRKEQEQLVLKQLGNDARARAADEGKDQMTKAGVSGGAKIGDRSGVLASYAALIRAHIRVNIRGFDPDRAPNNPEVIFEVSQLANGQITGIVMRQSSGNTAWDATVRRAIEASSPLPRAPDGSVEPVLTLSFRPQDPR